MPDFVFFLIFVIPVVAVGGGITMAILRMISQHRLLELAQRERIALIEKGHDPSKLPPAPQGGMGGWPEDTMRPYMESSRRRAQNMTIGGIVLLFLGASIGVFLYFVTGENGRPALVGLIPMALGAALLLSALIVNRDAASGRGGNGGGAPRA